MNQEALTQLPPLPPSAARTIDAADGWVTLGNAVEAVAELAQLSVEFLDHPTALAMEWKVATAVGKFARAWLAAKRLCELNPHSPAAWICQANALRELRGPQAAADLLLSVAIRFPSSSVVSYNLACFLAQEGEWGRASSWLLRAFQSEEGMKLKQMALLDPDLRPLWQRIGEHFDVTLYSVRTEEDAEQEVAPTNTGRLGALE